MAVAAERQRPPQTPLARRHTIARELERTHVQRHIKDVAKWWNQHAGGIRFEQDIDSWITDRFTAIEARRSLAETEESQSMDEIAQEGNTLAAWRVFRGRHLVSDFGVEKYVYEAKEYARRRRIDESIALDFVRDRLTSEGGIFDVIGVSSQRKRDELLELVA